MKNFLLQQKEHIEEILENYVKPLNIPASQVWLMPHGITNEQLSEKAQWIIEQCKKYGFNYADRLHIRIYGNKSGVQMCIICLQFQRDNDLVDARRMVEAARRELYVLDIDIDIDERHLREIESVLNYKEKLLKKQGEIYE